MNTWNIFKKCFGNTDIKYNFMVVNRKEKIDVHKQKLLIIVIDYEYDLSKKYFNFYQIHS